MTEKLTTPLERTDILRQTAAERSAELKNTTEKHKGESSQQERLDQARADAKKEALFSREITGSENNKDKDGTIALITQHDRQESYDGTMRQIRSEMKPSQQAFSKFIHAKPIEKASDFLGATIARPDAVLAGSICAFIGVIALYTFARHYGFALSGFETIAAFLIGWGIGVVFDFLKRMITGKN